MYVEAARREQRAALDVRGHLRDNAAERGVPREVLRARRRSRSASPSRWRTEHRGAAAAVGRVVRRRSMAVLEATTVHLEHSTRAAQICAPSVVSGGRAAARPCRQQQSISSGDQVMAFALVLLSAWRRSRTEHRSCRHALRCCAARRRRSRTPPRRHPATTPLPDRPRRPGGRPALVAAAGVAAARVAAGGPRCGGRPDGGRDAGTSAGRTSGWAPWSTRSSATGSPSRRWGRSSARWRCGSTRRRGTATTLPPPSSRSPAATRTW